MGPFVGAGCGIGEALVCHVDRILTFEYRPKFLCTRWSRSFELVTLDK